MIPQGSWSHRDVLMKWAYLFLEIQYEVWVHSFPQILHIICFSGDCFIGSFSSLVKYLKRETVLTIVPNKSLLKTPQIATPAALQILLWRNSRNGWKLPTNV